MNRKEELQQFIKLCMDMIELSKDPETIIYFTEELQEFSEEYIQLISERN